ncbi:MULTISPECIES: phosphatase PAP2 family protein [Chryseobacterium]|uniref:Membrane-associated phospholipid phosphatase n=1 Tax=Chryseobacterium camelliae TaxID=1265445 RepID=A0ABU0TG49_9FLAO|nr:MULTISPECIES: phosphatase PAP2 family protein [Chryseobacterium]MDT3406157.1 membrane-associated phospholipid phosphatase [Pseudacidovorax intermedius]MDQ1096040.1 membrane-associated phospholipid phosphatase [Chryseobacterium camelliae]MDQ1099976.1 membrane-associated phospholipid phosphatase [Chryseobacterium sp. SORGH_AS_1048]MDR6087322.1 membrane-associated phospholipid phosphatase [Chryseobacterium sp. SORGH_AS_0909]MDR6131697.1 membrane-associated phospholipid phosphatase [Chryseobact
MPEKQPSFVQKISKIISDFFNPLISLFIFFILMSIWKYSLTDSLYYFLPILLMVILPVIIWIVWNVKTGRYVNMDVSNRVQRKTLYIFIVICVMAYMVYSYLKNGAVDLVMLFILILLLALQISNFFIKSSMHTAFNVLVAALFVPMSWITGLIWLGIAVLVGVTRVILKRHTVREVLTGAGIAFVVSLIYLYCSMQLQP